MQNPKPKPPQVYFFQQSSLSRSCAVHTINHLLGRAVYTKQQLNEICFELSSDFINPYKSVFGGDFDVTPIICALAKHGVDVQWLKNNQDMGKMLEKSDLNGIILNEKVGNGFLTKVLRQSGRHWKCIRKISDNKFMYLDSLEKQPNQMDANAVLALLTVFQDDGGTILVATSLKPKKNS